MALMAIEWAPELSRPVGSTPTDRPLKLIAGAISSMGDYGTFRDTIVRAEDDVAPIYGSACRI